MHMDKILANYNYCCCAKPKRSLSLSKGGASFKAYALRGIFAFPR